jgi:hypothetical protein
MNLPETTYIQCIPRSRVCEACQLKIEKGTGAWKTALKQYLHPRCYCIKKQEIENENQKPPRPKKPRPASKPKRSTPHAG